MFEWNRYIDDDNDINRHAPVAHQVLDMDWRSDIIQTCPSPI